MLAKKVTTFEPESSAKGELGEGESSKKPLEDDLDNFMDKITKIQVKDIDDKKPPPPSSARKRLIFIPLSLCHL